MDLVGRDADLRVLGDAVGRLRESQSSLVLVRGSAGIGKTALLDATRRFAADADVAVLYACGGELEREFPYGVVRQLFEQVLWAMPDGQRTAALAGAAAHSSPVVAPYVPRPTEQSDSFAVLHGLYWLTVNLAQRGPLLVVVDDGHWADPSSLRFLGHLSHRLVGLPVMVVVGYRPGESEAADETFRVSAAEPGAGVIELAPLAYDAVDSLLRGAFAQEPDRAFVEACHTATGGNPFLVLELSRALAGADRRPTADAAALTLEVGPSSVAESIMARLNRMPDGSVALAQAVAVLGSGARLDLAAAIAGLDLATASTLMATLTAARILDQGPAVSFAHPVMRSAVHAAMTAAARSAGHARAAELLVAERADPDAVATHLVACAPAGDPDLVAALRSAAHHARDRGAPDAAASYLHRAIAEGGPAAADPDLLFELGMAEKLARHPSASEDLRAALVAAEKPDAQVMIACELSETLATSGQWSASLAVLDEVRDTSTLDHAAAVRLETQFATVAAWDPTRVTEFEQRIPRLLDLLDTESTASGRLALTVAANFTMRGGDEAHARRLLDRGLGEGRFLAEEGCDALELQLAGSVLVNAEDFDAAEVLAEQIIAEAHRRGSAYGFFTGIMMRARSATRAGDLARASGDLRSAFEVVGEHGLLLGVGSMLVYGADTIAERPELEDLAQLALALFVPDLLEGTPIGMVVHAARGRARLAAGDLAGAAEDLTAVGAVADAVSYRNPNALSWRSPLALAVRGAEPDTALELVQTELSDARRVGRPRAVGVALRTLGSLEGGEAGLAHLREAVATLDGSPARLEHARALVELGSAERRANRRAEAKETLRLALEGAHSVGALRLAEQAHQELLAAGARPRRPGLTGADALTPSERRVAQMAATGMSNPEIAQSLFVSLNTIETHLRHVFRKLAITRRTQLDPNLGD